MNTTHTSKTSWKQAAQRFVAFSLCNAPGTLMELGVLWMCSHWLFSGYVGRYLVAPILAFECSICIDFLLFSRFVWRKNMAHRTPRTKVKRFVLFHLSTAGVYLLRLGLIQVLRWCLGSDVVLCDLLSMIVSGFLNFGINDRFVFADHQEHRPGVRFLMGLVRPFVRLKVKGTEHIPNKEEGPVVYVCNHGFIYGPVAAVLNLPDTFRPWIHSRMLNTRECVEDLSHIFRRSFRLLGRKVQRKVFQRLSRHVVAVLNDFHPIPVFKDRSRQVADTLQQSIDTLTEGNNLLIFPELPRKSFDGHIRTEQREASKLRHFYSGFAKIGQSFYERTGRKLRFVPVYIDKKRHTMQIAPAITYTPTGNSHADRVQLSTALHAALDAMR